MLEAKLHPPPLREHCVPRPRPVQQLDAGWHAGHRLTLVSAPAGYGKTSLVGEWLAASSGSPAAWLSLDEQDNDPSRFWSYTIAALQTRHPSLGQSTLDALQSRQPPSLNALLVGLINELGTLPHHTLLILDDYHFITALPIQESLAFVLDHLPPTIHLAVVTRVDPSLPLARLRARNQLTELRADDLRFTSDEAIQFLNRSMRLTLTREDADALVSRTEGWAVGLQLAALSLQGQGNPHESVRAFTGSHHFVLEYLVDEVLRRQSESIQQFLIQTAILGRLCGDLCDEVTATNESNVLLADLHRANLFVMPLDAEHHWYRYHHLFADLLLARLRQTADESIPELHRRAAHWYERNGWAGDAIHHMLAAQDWDGAVRLMDQNIAAFIARGELTTVTAWLNSLPKEIARRQPGLGIQLAWARVLANQIKETVSLLDDVEPILNSSTALTLSEKESNRLKANVAVLRAFLALMSGNPREAGERARLARQLSATHPYERGWAYWISGYSARFLGELKSASEFLHEAIKVARESGNSWSQMVFMTDQGMIYGLLGQLKHAIEIYQETLRVGAEGGVRDHGYLARVEGALSVLLLQQDHLELARQHVERAIAWSERWPSSNHRSSGFAHLGRILIAFGDLSGAAIAIQRADEERRKSPVLPINNSIVDSAQVRFWLAEGDLAAAETWAEELDKSSSSGIQFIDEVHEMRLIARARVLIASAVSSESKTGLLEDALQLLVRLRTSAEQSQRVNSLIEIRVLEVLAFYHLSTRESEAPARARLVRDALDALESGLRLGEPGEYVRVFIDESQPMEELLKLLAHERIKQVAHTPAELKKYISKLVTAMNRAASATPVPSRPSDGLVEPLSAREIEILQMLADGLNNQEMARKLVLAPGTVKAHIANIYRKLDVHSRTQALAHARALELL